MKFVYCVYRDGNTSNVEVKVRVQMSEEFPYVWTEYLGIDERDIVVSGEYAHQHIDYPDAEGVFPCLSALLALAGEDTSDLRIGLQAFLSQILGEPLEQTLKALVLQKHLDEVMNKDDAIEEATDSRR